MSGTSTKVSQADSWDEFFKSAVETDRLHNVERTEVRAGMPIRYGPQEWKVNVFDRDTLREVTAEAIP